MNDMEELELIGTANASLSMGERETIITFNETSEPAEIFTYNKRLIRKLDSLCESREEIECVKTTSIAGAVSKQYRVPKKWVKVNAPPKTRNIEYTEEQRKVMIERLNKARAMRKAKNEAQTSP